MPRCFPAIAVALALATAATAATGCGGQDHAPAAAVYAATSLSGAFRAIDHAPRYDFAGSNTLQSQIERGAPADVFAGASPKEAQALYREQRCTRPVTFATNVLVLIVPKDAPGDVRSVYALRGAHTRLSVGQEGVPIGDYTRRLLGRLGLSSILTGPRVSQEANVGQVAAKVALGSADAGFVYRTDARAVANRVRTIPLPPAAQPPVRYQLCAVQRDGADTTAAEAFIRRVRSKAGRQTLRSFGFGLPPKG